MNDRSSDTGAGAVIHVVDVCRCSSRGGDDFGWSGRPDGLWVHGACGRPSAGFLQAFSSQYSATIINAAGTFIGNDSVTLMGAALKALEAQQESPPDQPSDAIE